MMSNDIFPMSENVTENDSFNFQESTPEIADVGKYFQSVTENGKIYSKCLIKNCCRRLEGNNIENLETHINVAHNINLNSTPSERLPIETNVSDYTAGLSMIETVNQSEAFQVQQSLSETDNARKYFMTVIEDGRIYSRCMIRNCMRRLAGNHLNNLKRHIRQVHDTPNVWSSDDDDDAVIDSVDENATDHDDTAKVRKYFRAVAEDGKFYSKCLMRHCKRRLAGDHLYNLKRHLEKFHNLKIELNIRKTPSLGPRKFFQCINVDGKLYSKCLIKDCKSRLAGDHRLNLERHLVKVHKLKSNTSSGRDDNLADKMPPYEEFIEGDSIEMQESASSRSIEGLRNDEKMSEHNTSSTQDDARKYFECVLENGKLYSKCLVEGCNCRLAGNHLNNMKRHLMKHNINLYSNKTSCHSVDEKLAEDTAQHADSGDDWIENSELHEQPNLFENTDARKFFKTVTENGKLFSKCLIRNCSRRIEGSSREKLARHLCIAHNMASEIVDSRSFFKCIKIDDKIYSRCLVQNCTRRIVGKHLNNLKKHLRGAHDMIIQPSCREMSSEMEDPRKYFESGTENGKPFSKCLVDDCGCRIAGKHLNNLKRHLMTHNINLHSAISKTRSTDEVCSDSSTSHTNESAQTGGKRERYSLRRTSAAPNRKSVPPSSVHSQTCRLCFEKMENGLEIFPDRLNIASTIRLHFPQDQVILLPLISVETFKLENVFIFGLMLFSR